MFLKQTPFFMKAIISGAFFMCLFISSSFSQSTEIDSLKNLLSSSNSAAMVDLSLKISVAYNGENIDSALFYADKALNYSNKISKEALIAKSNLNKGEILLDNNLEDFAGEYLFKALEYYKLMDSKPEQVKLENSIALMYYYQREYNMALEIAKEALTHSESNKNDEERAQAYLNLGNIYNRLNESELSLDNYLKCLKLRKKIGDPEKISSVLNNIGGYYSARADFENAIVYYQQTLDIRRNFGTQKGVGIALNNLGNQCLQIGEFDKAIEYYKEASEIFKEINFNIGTAATLTGMAIIYENLLQYNSALDVYKEVLAIRKSEKNDYELANTLNNIAITYSHMFNDSLENIYGKDFQDSIFEVGKEIEIEYGNQAISYNLQALEKRRAIEDVNGQSVTLANLGNMYLYHGNFEKASYYFTQYLELPDEVHDDDTQIAIQIGLGKMLMYQGDLNTAKVYFNVGLQKAEKINKKVYIKEATGYLSEIYSRSGDYKQAFAFHKRFHLVYDSLNQERTNDQISEMQVKYETEAKEKANELLRKDQIISETKLKNSRRALIAAIVVVLIFVVLIIQLIRENSLRKKANVELARKNKLITEQKKEITDSIQYASRIQNALLPPDEIIGKLLPNQFIIYRPRDIVSGDFYWFKEKNDKIIVMVADCTGHGVPGAFMSMLGIAFLNEIVSKESDLKADVILNELRRHVIESLHQTGKEGESQDGMDVCLYVIDKKNMNLEYAGANNPLLILRGDELIELKADKMPIGIHTNAKIPFTRREMKIEKGDMLYSFSDGYPDQFGGPKAKKFMIRRFKKLLAEINNEDLENQKQTLENTLDNWMKDVSQIDDIILMGVRID